jgi:surface antigen
MENYVGVTPGKSYIIWQNMMTKIIISYSPDINKHSINVEDYQ